MKPITFENLRRLVGGGRKKKEKESSFKRSDSFKRISIRRSYLDRGKKKQLHKLEVATQTVAEEVVDVLEPLKKVDSCVQVGPVETGKKNKVKSEGQGRSVIAYGQWLKGIRKEEAVPGVKGGERTVIYIPASDDPKQPPLVIRQLSSSPVFAKKEQPSSPGKHTEKNSGVTISKEFQNPREIHTGSEKISSTKELSSKEDLPISKEINNFKEKKFNSKERRASSEKQSSSSFSSKEYLSSSIEINSSREQLSSSREISNSREGTSSSKFSNSGKNLSNLRDEVKTSKDKFLGSKEKITNSSWIISEEKKRSKNGSPNLQRKESNDSAVEMFPWGNSSDVKKSPLIRKRNKQTSLLPDSGAEEMCSLSISLGRVWMDAPKAMAPRSLELPKQSQPPLAAHNSLDSALKDLREDPIVMNRLQKRTMPPVGRTLSSNSNTTASTGMFSSKDSGFSFSISIPRLSDLPAVEPPSSKGLFRKKKPKPTLSVSRDGYFKRTSGALELTKRNSVKRKSSKKKLRNSSRRKKKNVNKNEMYQVVCNRAHRNLRALKLDPMIFVPPEKRKGAVSKKPSFKLGLREIRNFDADTYDSRDGLYESLPGDFDDLSDERPPSGRISRISLRNEDDYFPSDCSGKKQCDVGSTASCGLSDDNEWNDDSCDRWKKFSCKKNVFLNEENDGSSIENRTLLTAQNLLGERRLSGETYLIKGKNLCKENSLFKDKNFVEKHNFTLEAQSNLFDKKTNSYEEVCNSFELNRLSDNKNFSNHKTSYIGSENVSNKRNICKNHVNEESCFIVEKSNRFGIVCMDKFGDYQKRRRNNCCEHYYVNIDGIDEQESWENAWVYINDNECNNGNYSKVIHKTNQCDLDQKFKISHQRKHSSVEVAKKDFKNDSEIYLLHNDRKLSLNENEKESNETENNLNSRIKIIHHNYKGTDDENNISNFKTKKTNIKTSVNCPGSCRSKSNIFARKIKNSKRNPTTGSHPNRNEVEDFEKNTQKNSKVCKNSISLEPVSSSSEVNSDVLNEEDEDIDSSSSKCGRGHYIPPGVSPMPKRKPIRRKRSGLSHKKSITYVARPNIKRAPSTLKKPTRKNGKNISTYSFSLIVY